MALTVRDGIKVGFGFMIAVGIVWTAATFVRGVLQASKAEAIKDDIEAIRQQNRRRESLEVKRELHASRLRRACQQELLAQVREGERLEFGSSLIVQELSGGTYWIRGGMRIVKGKASIPAFGECKATVTGTSQTITSADLKRY